MEYLGYSTTQFYFYNLCDCLDPVDNIYKRQRCANASIPGCRTYSDTLIAVKNGLEAQGIPFHHILLDSWWLVLRRLSRGCKRGETKREKKRKEKMKSLTTCDFCPSILLSIFFLGFRYGENIYNGVWKWEDSPDVMNVSFPESLKVFSQNLGSNRTLWAHNGALRPAGAAKQHEEKEEKKEKSNKLID